jgi:hypothetical protein
MTWRAIMETYDCPTCNAKAGHHCTTTGGKVRYECHVARALDADRCPKCGSRLAALAVPGDLCDRCQMVRNLEIERASVWVRRT